MLRLLVMCPSLLWSVTVSQSSLVFHDLYSLEVLVRYSVKCLPNWVCLMLFHDYKGCGFSEKNTAGVKCTSHHIMSEAAWCPRNITGDTNLHHLVNVVFVSCLLKLLFFLYLLEMSPVTCPGGGVSVYTCHLEFFSKADLPPLPLLLKQFTSIKKILFRILNINLSNPRFIHILFKTF